MHFGNTVPKDAVNETHERELQDVKLMKNTKPKVQGCLACEHGLNVILFPRYTVECRHTTPPSLVTDSLWTVKFDAHGTVLKRHDRDDEADTRSPQRVRCTHKQPDKRTDMGRTRDTVAERAKLSESPSSSSSSHEVVPKLHDSSGETADADLGESARKKSRVDADMEISAIEILTSAKLGSRSSTRH